MEPHSLEILGRIISVSAKSTVWQCVKFQPLDLDLAGKKSPGTLNPIF